MPVPAAVLLLGNSRRSRLLLSLLLLIAVVIVVAVDEQPKPASMSVVLTLSFIKHGENGIIPKKYALSNICFIIYRIYENRTGYCTATRFMRSLMYLLEDHILLFHRTILGVPFHIRLYVSIVQGDHREILLMNYNSDQDYTEHC
jgi:hypothetical protein